MSTLNWKQPDEEAIPRWGDSRLTSFRDLPLDGRNSGQNVTLRANTFVSTYCALDTEDISRVTGTGANSNAAFFESPGLVRLHPELREPLTCFVQNTNYFAQEYGIGYGRIEVIGHAGAYVTPDADYSDWRWHYSGHAIDVSWVGWVAARDEIGEVHVASRPCNGIDEAENSDGSTAHRRIVAVEAGLRKWFGTVISRNYNIPHRNHFHADIGRPVRPRMADGDKARTDALFVQDCIRAFTEYRPSFHENDNTLTFAENAVNAHAGEAYREGFRALVSDFGMECFDVTSDIGAYLLFLDYVMMHGFADESAGAFRWGE